MRHSFAPFNADAALFLSEATGIDFTRVDFAGPEWLCVSGYDDSGRPMGLCCFEFKNAFDAYFNIAILDPRCITRRIMRAMFTAVFARAKRVSAEIDPANEHAIRLARRMGFQPEGYKRLSIEGERDAVLLGMLAEDCIYLPRPRRRPAAFPLSEVRHGLHA